MEEIEYLEEYEDLILPAISTSTSTTQRVSNSRLNTMATNPQLPEDEDSSSIDQDIFESLFDDNSDDDNVLPKKIDTKFNERRNEHASLDSLDMLVKDLGEQLTQCTSTPQTGNIGQTDSQATASNTPSGKKVAAKVVQHKPHSTGASSVRSKVLASGTKANPVQLNKPKSIATVRPTLQSQEQKRLSLQPKSTLNRTILPTTRNLNAAASSSARLNAPVRTQTSTVTSSTTSTMGGRASITHTAASTKMGAIQNKGANRPPATIIKPEKPTVCKDPAEDPLKLDSENVGNGSDSPVLYSDISEDSFASLADLNDFEEDEGNAKDNMSNKTAAASPFAATAAATMTAAPNTESQKHKLKDSLSDEVTVLQTSTARSVLEITKNLPEKVTIISDTILTRIDTAFLQSISCKSDIQGVNKKFVNFTDFVPDEAKELQSSRTEEPVKLKDQIEENSNELVDIISNALGYMPPDTEPIENAKELQSNTPKLESNAKVETESHEQDLENNTNMNELPRMSPDLENVANVEEVAMQCNVEDEEQIQSNSISEEGLQEKSTMENVMEITAETETIEETENMEHKLAELEHDTSIEEDINVVSKKEEEENGNKHNVEDNQDDLNLNDEEDMAAIVNNDEVAEKEIQNNTFEGNQEELNSKNEYKQKSVDTIEDKQESLNSNNEEGNSSFINKEIEEEGNLKSDTFENEDKQEDSNVNMEEKSIAIVNKETEEEINQKNTKEDLKSLNEKESVAIANRETEVEGNPKNDTVEDKNEDLKSNSEGESNAIINKDKREEEEGKNGTAEDRKEGGISKNDDIQEVEEEVNSKNDAVEKEDLNRNNENKEVDEAGCGEDENLEYKQEELNTKTSVEREVGSLQKSEELISNKLEASCENTEKNKTEKFNKSEVKVDKDKKQVNKTKLSGIKGRRSNRKKALPDESNENDKKDKFSQAMQEKESVPDKVENHDKVSEKIKENEKLAEKEEDSKKMKAKDIVVDKADKKEVNITHEIKEKDTKPDQNEMEKYTMSDQIDKKEIMSQETKAKENKTNKKVEKGSDPSGKEKADVIKPEKKVEEKLPKEIKDSSEKSTRKTKESKSNKEKLKSHVGNKKEIAEKIKETSSENAEKNKDGKKESGEDRTEEKSKESAEVTNEKPAKNKDSGTEHTKLVIELKNNPVKAEAEVTQHKNKHAKEQAHEKKELDNGSEKISEGKTSTVKVNATSKDITSKSSLAKPKTISKRRNQWVANDAPQKSVVNKEKTTKPIDEKLSEKESSAKPADVKQIEIKDVRQKKAEEENMTKETKKSNDIDEKTNVSEKRNLRVKKVDIKEQLNKSVAAKKVELDKKKVEEKKALQDRKELKTPADRIKLVDNAETKNKTMKQITLVESAKKASTLDKDSASTQSSKAAEITERDAESPTEAKNKDAESATETRDTDVKSAAETRDKDVESTTETTDKGVGSATETKDKDAESATETTDKDSNIATEKASAKTVESAETSTKVCEKLETASVSEEKDAMQRRSLRKRCAESPLPINDAAKQLFKEPLSSSTIHRNKETVLSIEITPHIPKRSLRSPVTDEKKVEDNGPASTIIKSDNKRKSGRLRYLDNSERASDTSESESEECKRFKADTLKGTHRHLEKSSSKKPHDLESKKELPKNAESAKLLEEKLLKTRELKAKELSNKKPDAAVMTVKPAQYKNVTGKTKSNTTANADEEPAHKVAALNKNVTDKTKSNTTANAEDEPARKVAAQTKHITGKIKSNTTANADEERAHEVTAQNKNVTGKTKTNTTGNIDEEPARKIAAHTKHITGKTKSNTTANADEEPAHKVTAQNKNVSGKTKTNTTGNADEEPARKVARIELQKDQFAEATTIPKSKESLCHTSPEKKQINPTQITDKLKIVAKEKSPAMQRKNLRSKVGEEELISQPTQQSKDQTIGRKSLRSKPVPEENTKQMITDQKKVECGTSKESGVVKIDLGKTVGTSYSDDKLKTNKQGQQETAAGKLKSTTKSSDVAEAPVKMQTISTTKMNTKSPTKSSGTVMTFNEWRERQKSEKDIAIPTNESADTNTSSKSSAEELGKSPSKNTSQNAEAEKEKSVEQDKIATSSSVSAKAIAATPTTRAKDMENSSKITASKQGNTAIENVVDKQVTEEKSKQSITKTGKGKSASAQAKDQAADDVPTAEITSTKSNVADIVATKDTSNQTEANENKQIEDTLDKIEKTDAEEQFNLIDEIKQSTSPKTENDPITEAVIHADKLEELSVDSPTSAAAGMELEEVKTIVNQMKYTKSKAQSKKKKVAKLPDNTDLKVKEKPAKPHKRSEIEVLLDAMPKEMKESCNLELLFRDNDRMTKRKLANTIANTTHSLTTATTKTTPLFKVPPEPQQVSQDVTKEQQKKSPKLKKLNEEKLSSKDLLKHWRCRNLRVRINRAVVSQYLRKFHMPTVQKKKRKPTAVTLDNRRFKLKAPSGIVSSHATRASSKTAVTAALSTLKLSTTLPSDKAAVSAVLNKSLPTQLVEATKLMNSELTDPDVESGIAAMPAVESSIAAVPAVESSVAVVSAASDSYLGESSKCAQQLETRLRATVAGRANVLTIPPQNRRPPQTTLASAKILITPEPATSSYKQKQSNEDDYEQVSPNTTAALLDGDSDMGTFLLTPMKSMPVAEAIARKQPKRLPAQKEKPQASARSNQIIIPTLATTTTVERVAPLLALSVAGNSQTAVAVSLATSIYGDVKEEMDECLDAREKSPTTIANDAAAAAALSFAHGSNGTAFGVTPTTIDGNGTRLYSFLHPAKYNRSHGNVMLDYCCPNLDGPMPAIDPTRIHAQVQSAVRELPAYIVMTTKLITRADLQANKNAIPASIRQKVEKITANSGSGSSGKTTVTVGGSIATVIADVTPATMTAVGSLSILPPTVTALQKHLPPTTTITPKVLPPNTATVTVTTPNSGLPPLTPFSAFSSAQHQPTIPLSDMQRNQMRSNLRRFDAMLKKYYHRIAVLTFADRQRIVESIIHTNNATGGSSFSYNFVPKDVDSAIRLLEAYAQQMHVILPAPTILVTSATMPTVPDTIAVAGNGNGSGSNRSSKRTTTVATTLSMSSTLTPPCSRKLHVPIYDDDRNVIGWQMQVSGTTTAASSTSSAVTKTTMSTRSDIMSTTSQTPPYSAVKRAIVPVQNASASGVTTGPLLKQPAQDSPRIFYTKPPLQTSTPIAASGSALAIATTTVSPQSITTLSPADATFIQKNVTRLGRSITLRKLTSSTISTTTTTPPVSRTPNLGRAAQISITVSKTKTSTSCVTLKSNEPPATPEQHTPMRMTRKSAAAAAAAAAGAAVGTARKLIVISKDSIGNNLNTDECILPDNTDGNMPNAEIKHEQLDDDFISGN